MEVVSWADPVAVVAATIAAAKIICDKRINSNLLPGTKRRMLTT